MKEGTKGILGIGLIAIIIIAIAFGINSWWISVTYDTSFNIVSYNHSGVLVDVTTYRGTYLIMDFATDEEYAFIRIGFNSVNVETYLDIINYIDENVTVYYDRIEYIDEDFKRLTGIQDYTVFKSIETL